MLWILFRSICIYSISNWTKHHLSVITVKSNPPQPNSEGTSNAYKHTVDRDGASLPLPTINISDQLPLKTLFHCLFCPAYQTPRWAAPGDKITSENHLQVPAQVRLRKYTFMGINCVSTKSSLDSTSMPLCFWPSTDQRSCVFWHGCLSIAQP